RALLSLVVRYRRRGDGPCSRILGVDPDTAACVLESIKAGEPVAVPGPHLSIIAGLNCDTPSLIAWPDLKGGIDAFISVSDEDAKEGMRALAGQGVVSGETCAAGLAGLTEAVAVSEPVNALGLNAA